MRVVHTMANRIGSRTLETETLIYFEEGLIGLCEYKTFVLKQGQNLAPFRLLQCTEREDLSFLVIDPTQVLKHYHDLIPGRDWTSIGLQQSNQIAFAICTIGPGAGEVSANLQAPILVDTDRMIGRQVILTDSELSAR